MRTKSDIKKRGILRTILNYSKANSYPPTQNEIATELQMPVSRINSYVAEMANQGYLKAQAHISRSLVVTEEGINFCKDAHYPVPTRDKACHVNSYRNTLKSYKLKKGTESNSVLYMPRFLSVFEMFYFSDANLKRIYKFKALKNNEILHVSDGDEILVKACKDLKKGQWFVALDGNGYFLQSFASAKPTKTAVTTDEETILFRKNAADNSLIVGKVIKLIRNLE